jgi:hypothetical protein
MTTFFAILYQEAAMTPQTEVQHQLVSLFADRPCWMIGPLANRLDYSIPSVRRFLMQTGYYSSFTHNGRWYTLASIPKFSAEGLWFHEEIGFSRAGSLTNTLVNLVSKSKSGMTSEQLGQMLHCRCHSVLVGLFRQERLQRQKRGRAFIYVSADEQTAASQLQVVSNTEKMALPAEIAVLILVEYIHYPEAGFSKLAQRIGRRAKVQIEASQVKALFERYGLKKTA